MTSEQLIANFDRISEAPGAVSKLRQFIIDLAICGKLVQQDVNDEPASELLNRIQRHKTKLALTGGIRISTIATSMHKARGPFELPSGWSWAKWDSIALKIGDIDHKMPETVQGGVPFISPRDFLPHNGIDFDNAKHISFEDFFRLSKKMKAQVGDLIYPRYGTIGETRLVTQRRDFLVSYSCAVIKVLQDYIDPKYQYFFSLCTYCRQQARYAENKTTQANVGIKSIQEFILPIPPLAEQSRIVGKIEELMSICTRLEAAQTERERRRDTVVSASLHHITNGADPEILRDHARSYLNHLPRMTVKKVHIQQLRQTILSLAVQGKLVPQSSDDESGAELLKRITAQKSRLVHEKAFRRKILPAIREGDEPFSLPAKWQWVRIGTLALLTEYGTSVRSENVEKGVPVLKMGDIQGGKVLLGGQTRVPLEIDDLPHLLLKRFDVLYNRTNSAELVGKTGIYMGCDDTYTFASYLIRIRFLNHLTSPVYINFAMNARYFRETQIVPELQQQCGQANVNGSKLRNMLIPLPPLAEQHRIVAKIEELMAVCEHLEAQLSGAQRVSEALLDVILADALSAFNRHSISEEDVCQLTC